MLNIHQQDKKYCDLFFRKFYKESNHKKINEHKKGTRKKYLTLTQCKLPFKILFLPLMSKTVEIAA